MNVIKKIIEIVLTVLISTSYVFGQSEKATTESGKIVILNSDGTWKYNETLKTIQSNTDINDCSNWILTQIDKVDGASFTAGKKPLEIFTDGGKKGFRIIMLNGSHSDLIISIQAFGAGSCIDKDDKINILFTDGSRLLLKNDADFNCKSKSTVIFGGSFGKKRELEELKSKRIQIMRVWTSDGFVEKDFNEDNQIEFYNVINCLTK